MYSASITSFSRIACFIIYAYNINININNNIIYATYIKREYRVRRTKTLFLFFLYNYEILINLFKYNILIKY